MNHGISSTASSNRCRITAARNVFSCAPATLSGGSRAPATGQEGGGATVVAISADRIHERVIAEAPPGSEIVSWRVTGAGDALHVAWMDKSKTVWIDGKPAAGPYDEVKYLAFRMP